MRLLVLFIFLVVDRSSFPQSTRPTFTNIADGVAVHITFNNYKGEPVASNGLIVLTRDSVVLIDTGWGIRNTKAVMRHIKRAYNRPVAACFSTHFHADRTGGIPVLRKHGVRSMGTQATHDLALARGEEVPDIILSPDTTIVIDGTAFELFHPGAGHTQDNVVVWLPAQRILHGGCLVKSTEAEDLGNIADADLASWPQTIRVLQTRFSTARLVVPGHDAWGGLELLDHTLRLLEEHGR